MPPVFLLPLPPPSAWGEARHYLNIILTVPYVILYFPGVGVVGHDPLRLGPAIALAIGDYIVGELFAEVDAQETVSEALLPEASFLAGPSPRAVAVRGAAQDFWGNKG